MLVEKTDWLKKYVVKAVVLMLLYSLLSTVIGLFISLGAKALNGKTITILVVDKLIDKYMDKE